MRSYKYERRVCDLRRGRTSVLGCGMKGAKEYPIIDMQIVPPPGQGIFVYLRDRTQTSFYARKGITGERRSRRRSPPNAGALVSAQPSCVSARRRRQQQCEAAVIMYNNPLARSARTPPHPVYAYPYYIINIIVVRRSAKNL